jgi:hypothetical protein
MNDQGPQLVCQCGTVIANPNAGGGQFVATIPLTVVPFAE